jgi:hypothetical protein
MALFAKYAHHGSCYFLTYSHCPAPLVTSSTYYPSSTSTVRRYFKKPIHNDLVEIVINRVKCMLGYPESRPEMIHPNNVLFRYSRTVLFCAVLHTCMLRTAPFPCGTAYCTLLRTL